MALHAASVLDGADLPPPETTRIEPIADHLTVYRDALGRQQALYEALLSQ